MDALPKEDEPPAVRVNKYSRLVSDEGGSSNLHLGRRGEVPLPLFDVLQDSRGRLFPGISNLVPLRDATEMNKAFSKFWDFSIRGGQGVLAVPRRG